MVSYIQTMKSYKELIVWQKSYDLTLQIYAISRKFPKEELFGLTSQIRRASVSIPSNIAEGSARAGTKEFIQFLRIAYGSGAELETQLLLCKDLSLINEKEYTTISLLLTEIMKMLNSLMAKLN